jgi:4-amino-4-deoxy-L-arabinose transferase-like glycosyltransferase
LVTKAASFSSASSGAQSHRRLYWALLSIGFVLRFGFALWRKTYIQQPGNSYPYAMEVSSIAAHIARGQGFSSPFLKDTGPTSWVGPLYPYLEAGIFKIFGIYTSSSALAVIGLQCVMGAATAIAIHALGKRTLGNRIAIWAAWIWTVSPFFFRWPVTWIWDFTASALLLTTILAVAFTIAESGSRKQWLILGTLWGIAALTNPALISLAPFTYLYAAFWTKRRTHHSLANLLYSVALMVTLISPWAIRNAVVFGHPIFLRSNFWFEFHLGNFHYSNGMGYLGFHPGCNVHELRRYTELGEYRYVEWAKQQAIAFVRQYPGEFLDLTLHRPLWFWDGTSILYQGDGWWRPWNFWPLSASAWLGLIFVLTRRPPGWFLYACSMVVYPLPYYFVYPAPKYRHAIEPAMLLLTVYLASVLWSELGLLKARRNQSAVVAASVAG